jgi:hypothetical protein
LNELNEDEKTWFSNDDYEYLYEILIVV